MASQATWSSLPFDIFYVLLAEYIPWSDFPAMSSVCTSWRDCLVRTVQEEVAALDELLKGYAQHDKICNHLMTIPGIGVVTSVAYTAAVDDPKRFKNSRSVGAYFGLTSRRYQSGDVDYSGHISKCGYKLVRSYLYEAAGVLLTRTKKWSALKSWGLRIAKRSGMSKAKVAVARKLAVIMHQMWLTGEAFRCSEPDTVAA